MLLLKQAFIAFVFGFYDRTHLIISGLRDEAASILGTARDPNLAYLLFLNTYAEFMKTYPDLYPVRYSDIFGPERSAKRFTTGLAGVKYDQVQSAWLDSREHVGAMEDLSKLLSDDFIGIEVLANQFHLAEHAEQLRKIRREQVDGVLKWLRMERAPTQPT